MESGQVNFHFLPLIRFATRANLASDFHACPQKILPPLLHLLPLRYLVEIPNSKTASFLHRPISMMDSKNPINYIYLFIRILHVPRNVKWKIESINGCWLNFEGDKKIRGRIKRRRGEKLVRGGIVASKQEGVGDQGLRPDVHVKRRHPWLHNRSEPGKLGYPLLWENTSRLLAFQATAKSGIRAWKRSVHVPHRRLAVPPS